MARSRNLEKCRVAGQCAIELSFVWVCIHEPVSHKRYCNRLQCLGVRSGPVARRNLSVALEAFRLYQDIEIVQLVDVGDSLVMYKKGLEGERRCMRL